MAHCHHYYQPFFTCAYMDWHRHTWLEVNTNNKTCLFT